MEYIIENLAWTMEAWMIPMEDSVKWEMKWDSIYGELPKGEYRLGKEFMDFRKTADYDTCVRYVNFVID